MDEYEKKIISVQLKAQQKSEQFLFSIQANSTRLAMIWLVLDFYSFSPESLM